MSIFANALDVAPLDPATLTTELVAIIEPIGFFGATATDLELMPQRQWPVWMLQR